MKLHIILFHLLLAASISSVDATTSTANTSTFTELGHQSSASATISGSTQVPNGHQSSASASLYNIGSASSTAGNGHQSSSTNVGSMSSTAVATPTGSSDGNRAFQGDGMAVMGAAMGAVGVVMAVL